MDFGSILSAAQKNAKSTSGSNSNNYYSTKFEPPKKDSKEKKLSAGIRRFLAQKDEEERKKEKERQKNYDELMSARTDREKNKIRKMLKVTKSANRSVLEEAVSQTDTAVTLDGPEQPDEDDYGYTSHAAGALYKNLMDKYKSQPEDKKFADNSGRQRSTADLKSTKDRVREAIMREKEDEKLGRKRSAHGDAVHTSQLPSEHKHRSRKNLYDPMVERDEEERRRKEDEDQRRKIKLKRPPPPVMDFQKLMKLAEEKQHVPVQIVVPEKKPKEPERLLTSKEKREIELKRAEAEERERNRKLKTSDRQNNNNTSGEERKTGLLSNGRIPKLNGYSAAAAKPKPSNGAAAESRTPNGPMKREPARPTPTPTSASIRPPSKTSTPLPRPSSSASGAIRPIGAPKPSPSPAHQSADRRIGSVKQRPAESPKSASKPQPPSARPTDAKSVKSRDLPPKETIKSRDFPPKDVARGRDFPPKDVARSRDFPPKDVARGRDFPPKDVARSRDFPPKDVARGREFPPKDVVRSREFPSRDMHRPQAKANKKGLAVHKRRILDDDDESEYDSEMDDFIDDDDAEEDYSRHIRDIFGYDKSRYRDDDYDSDNMESNFAQQQREEFVSKKIGMLEDLEDMRQEEEERKQKAKRRRIK